MNEIINQTSCLSLLSHAAVIGNTIPMQKIVDPIRAAGQTVQDEELARNGPLLHAHMESIRFRGLGSFLNWLFFGSWPEAWIPAPKDLLPLFIQHVRTYL